MEQKDIERDLTVSEAAHVLGIAESRLRYYEKKGLVTPRRTESGYRMYSRADLERLRNILLLRRFDFSIREIRQALADPDFDPEKLLAKQEQVQRQRARHAEKLAGIAAAVRFTGLLPDEAAMYMAEPEAFAEEDWDLFRALRLGSEQIGRLRTEGFACFNESLGIFAALRGTPPDSEEAQAAAGAFFRVICDYFAPIGLKLYLLIARIFASEGAAARDVYAHSGEGTAAYAAECIRIWCERRKSQIG